MNQTLKLISNWITSSYGKYVISKHIARVALYQLVGINSLYPQVRALAQQLIDEMQRRGKPIFIVPRTGTFRSAQQQESLSKNVTNADALQSYHNYGLAFDVAFEHYKWNPPDVSWWDELGSIGKSNGLVWGGDWQMKDLGHFEWHGVREEYTWEKLKPYFEKE